ncbi:MAG: ABC transporter permease, partial [Bacteroidota bacterium]
MRALRRLIKPEYYEDISGDLSEQIRLYEIKPSREALWLWREVILLLHPTLLRPLFNFDNYKNSNTMLFNYLRMASRQFKKYKMNTTINLVGLSTGMAACILIFLFVQDELSYDQHHEHAEDVYRVTVKNYNQQGQLSRQWAFASAGHAERLKADYPAITHTTRFFPWAFPDLTYGDQRLPGEPVIFADDDVFDIFTFPFIIGSPETAFNDVFSLVLTESSAIRVFGNEWREMDLLEKTVVLEADGQSFNFKVTGVMKDMPDQQHFHFDYLAPIRMLAQAFGEEAMNNVGGNYNWLTYMRTAPNTDIAQLTEQMPDFWDKYIDPFNGGNASEFYEFEFQPLLDIHLNSNLEGEYESNGSLQQVYIFSIVGVLLLLIACVNYMNLSTSHFTRRLKEIGIRKVLGSGRQALITQFLVESILITLISLPIALLLAAIALPVINDFVEKSLALDLVSNWPLIATLVGLLLIIGLAAGLYPALFLSKLNMIQSLRGKLSARPSRLNFRSVLVTVQYAVVLGLIFALTAIESQIAFINNSDPGYRKEAIVDLRLTRNVGNLETFKTRLLSNQNIRSASYASRIPTGRLADSWGAQFYKGDSAVSLSFRLPVITVDEDFLSTFDISLAAGENFTRSMDTFSDSVGYYIINRAAAEALGYNDPNEIIGENLHYGQYKGRIYGVTEDFHFESLHSPIVPMVMVKTTSRARRISMQVNTANLPETLRFLETTWAEFDQENPAEYRFLEERFAEQYEQEQRLSQMITVFTVIAILIGCLGLVGMVGFLIDTKTKEIGVRKVLGATIWNILIVISNHFTLLIVVAFVLITPVAYYLMNDWLETFVYRIDLGPFIILLPV